MPTGILKGEGKNVDWSNQTLIYPDSILTKTALMDGLEEWIDQNAIVGRNETLTFEEVLQNLRLLGEKYDLPCGNWSNEKFTQQITNILNPHQLSTPNLDQTISRSLFAIILDEFVDPFHLRGVDYEGNFLY